MRIISLTALAAFSLNAVSPAFAWGPSHAPVAALNFEQAKFEYKWKSDGCKYKYKADKNGVKEKYKCK
jgi:hypothetical protein